MIANHWNHLVDPRSALASVGFSLVPIKTKPIARIVGGYRPSVLAVLAHGAATSSEIVAETGITLKRVWTTLCELNADGVVRPVGRVGPRSILWELV